MWFCGEDGRREKRAKIKEETEQEGKIRGDIETSKKETDKLGHKWKRG